MVVDFSKIDVEDRQTLVLCTNDGTPIGVLGYAYGVVAEICYNEVSKLTFNIPAYVDGERTPHYDNVIGTRLLDIKGVGLFILTNPKVKHDGIKESKECTAYSLEYEFTYKKLSLENATYNFWNPVARGGTILDILMERMPSWSVGTVDSDLISKYRTFDVSGENLYNFIKSTVQESYQCVFEFDTYGRKVNVRSVHSSVSTRPVYISFDNLIKDVEIEEDSESIVTCLDVSGADGVTIRSVNPMGSNKIYDLGYFMNTTNFSQAFIDKYNSWKAAFESYQLPYYNLSVESALKTTEWLTENAALTDLYGKLKNLESQQAVVIQSIAQGLMTQSDLNAINAQIAMQNTEISAKKAVISNIDNQLDGLTAQMASINSATAFSTFFTAGEMLMLDKYIKEDSISDSSFVAPSVKNYNTADVSNVVKSTPYAITGANVTKVVTSLGKDLYTITGGTLTVATGIQINADIVKASYEVDSSKNFLFTAYFTSGRVDGSSFPSGCLSLTGTISGATSSNVTADPALPQYFRGTRVSFTVSSARFYFTQNTTAYEQRSVEWDLYEYGRECLEKLSTPSFRFSVSMADFLSLDAFVAFKNSIALGHKVYLKIDDAGILQPIVVKCVIDFENQSNFKLEFCDTYKTMDAELRLADVLEKSASTGNKLDLKQFTYNAWVESGAETSVSQFLTSALDVAKNAILSTRGQAPTLDETGLRIRKRLDDGNYDPKQMWAVSNSLMFTSDNWNTAELAIGEFVDDNIGSCWGVVAKTIVGTLIAGNSLVIESAKQDAGSGKAVFRVDGSGAALYNATFDIYNGANTQITLNPYTGFAIGKYPLYTGNNYTIKEENANFWVDMAGNVHMKGTLHGVDGTFSGELEAATGSFSGELKAATGTFSGNLVAVGGTFSGDISAASGIFQGTIQAFDFLNQKGNSMLVTGSDNKFKPAYLELKGLEIKDRNDVTTFKVDSDGNVTVSGNIIMTSGSIRWGGNGVPHDADLVQDIGIAYNYADSAWGYAASAWDYANDAQGYSIGVNNALNALKTGIGYTFINNKYVISPNIIGGSIEGVTIQFGDILENGAFGSVGSMYATTGWNGVNETNVVTIRSSKGMILYAQDGLRIQSDYDKNSGVWLQGRVCIQRFDVGGGYNYIDVSGALVMLANALGFTLPVV